MSNRKPYPTFPAPAPGYIFVNEEMLEWHNTPPERLVDSVSRAQFVQDLMGEVGLILALTTNSISCRSQKEAKERVAEFVTLLAPALFEAVEVTWREIQAQRAQDPAPPDASDAVREMLHRIKEGTR